MLRYQKTMNTIMAIFQVIAKYNWIYSASPAPLSITRTITVAFRNRDSSDAECLNCTATGSRECGLIDYQTLEITILTVNVCEGGGILVNHILASCDCVTQTRWFWAIQRSRQLFIERHLASGKQFLSGLRETILY